MTWLTTWPKLGQPQYAEHATEAEAEAHAVELVRSGTTSHATAFQANDVRVLPDEEQPND